MNVPRHLLPPALREKYGVGIPTKTPRAARRTGRVGAGKAAACAAAQADAGREPIRLVLPYGPGVNHLYATVRGRRVLSRVGREYKAGVARLAVGVVPFAADVAVSVDVFRPLKAGDLDGRLKCLLDALTGVAWVDDRQVVAITARRFDDKLRPRAEVTVMPVGSRPLGPVNIRDPGSAGEGTV